MAWPIISGIINSAFGIIKEPIVEWQRRKTIKAEAVTVIEKLHAEAELSRAKVTLEMAKKGQKIEADWDSRAQEQMKYSWKDEILMLILYFPVVTLFLSAFTPEEYGFQDRIIESVKALEEFPMWYVVILLGIVATVFALRWLIAPLVQSKLFKKK